MRISVLAAVILTGCASVQPPEAPIPESTWTNQCYANFDRDVREIAGPSARDCGFVPRGAAPEAPSAAKACAQKAMASSEPFKIGYEGFGIDSAFCHAAIRRADGQLVSVKYDFDVTGRNRRDGRHDKVSTSTCAGMEFEPYTMGRGAFFTVQDCAKAEDILDGLSSRR